MGDALLGSAIMLGVPVYIVLQIVLPCRASGGWRWAALAPLAIAAPLALICLYAFSQESNLWPLTFILFAPFGVTYLVIVEIAHYLWRPVSD